MTPGRIRSGRRPDSAEAGCQPSTVRAVIVGYGGIRAVRRAPQRSCLESPVRPHQRSGSHRKCLWSPLLAIRRTRVPPSLARRCCTTPGYRETSILVPARPARSCVDSGTADLSSRCSDESSPWHQLGGDGCVVVLLTCVAVLSVPSCAPSPRPQRRLGNWPAAFAALTDLRSRRNFPADPAGNRCPLGFPVRVLCP